MWFNKYRGIISGDGARPLTDLENLLGGMSAGCFSTLGNNPFDVVKTKMQGVDASKYKNTVDCFVQVRCLVIGGCKLAGLEFTAIDTISWSPRKAD